ncbi:MAG: CoA transferase [Proteobacteria bacterium]|nr:CoA transferase [Pseudomonadota bacterium]
MSKPFTGVKILDFTQVFAGPFSSFQLALLGADVIKVERPEGEDSRFTPLSKEWADMGMAPSWMAVNANKRNLTLDLKNPTAVEIVKKLVLDADVVMENFRPGVMDRLGIGYDDLSKINPRLIYCGVSGFGREGPQKNAPSYDGKIQALSGVMSITGHEGDGPLRAGFAVCDALTGMTAAFAVSSAIFQRTHTGKGQLVDVAMFDSTLSFLSPTVVDYTVAGHRQRQFGNQAISRKPTANLFRVKNGYLLLAVNNEGQYIKLAKTLNRPELYEDARFKDWPSRIENETAMREIIEDALSTNDAQSWEKILEEGGAPCASVRTIDEAVAHPQLEYRDVLQTVEGPKGPMTMIGSGFKLAHGGGSIDRPPPTLGQHTDEILAAAGYSAAEIAKFRADKVL